jgi:hypothetical protein
MIYFCVKFQKDPLFGVNLTFFLHLGYHDNGRQLHHIETISVCYGGHFESKMTAKIQKSSDLDEIWFPSRL